MLICQIIFLLFLQLSDFRSVSCLPNCDFRKVECAKSLLASIAEPFTNKFPGRVNERLFKLKNTCEEILQKMNGRNFLLPYRIQVLKSFVKEITDKAIQSNLDRRIDAGPNSVNDSLTFVQLFSRTFPEDAKLDWDSFSYDALTRMKLISLHEDDHQLFDYLTSNMVTGDVCGIRFSLQEVMYELYKTLMSTEITRFFIAMFDYKLTTILHKKLIKENITTITNRTISRMNSLVGIFVERIERVPRYFRHCDPKSQEEVENYVGTMGDLFQTMLFREIDYNPNSCAGQCSDIDEGQNLNNFECGENKHTPNYCPQKKPCSGRIYKCETMNTVSVCRGNKTRYQWFRDEETQITYGSDSVKCPDNNLFIYRGSSSRTECEICRCVCVNSDPHPTLLKGNFLTNPDRNASVFMISTNSITSWKAENLVVTDVALKVECSTLSLEIRENRLDKNMKLKPGVATKSVGCLNRVFAESPIEQYLMDRNQYVIINEEEFNTINLENVIVPDGRVVTGVRFAESRKSRSKGRIELQVESMEYNVSTGKLIPSTEEWTSSPHRNTVEIELNDEEYDIPTRVLETNDIISEPGSFVRFTLSSLKKDAGQSVVPFIEQKKIADSPISPLAGVGLYHKRSTSNAGYLAIKLISLNYGAMIKQ